MARLRSHGVTRVLSWLQRLQPVRSGRVPRAVLRAVLLWLSRLGMCYSGFESCRGHFVGGRRVAFVLFTVGVQVEARLALIFLACRVRLRCRVCARARL